MNYMRRQDDALKRAVDARNCNEIKILLARGADINHTVNQHLDTMLHKANNAGIVRDLLGYSANVNVKNLFDRTPLHSAAIEGKQGEVVKTLLEHAASVNARDAEGLTPLHYAVKNKQINVEAIKWLIMFGADVDYINDLSNHPSPLYTALKLEDPTYAKVLIKYKLLKKFHDNFTKVFNLSTYYRAKNFHTVRLYLNECGAEILRMKNEKMSDEITLFQMVMSKCVPLEKLYKNSESTKLFTERSFAVITCNKYPIYRDVIIEILKSKLEVSSLRKQLRVVHISCANMDSGKEQITLNEDITSIVAKYLSKNDLFNLIIASFEPFNHPVVPRTSMPWCQINRTDTLNALKRTYSNVFVSSTVTSCAKYIKFK